MQAVEADCATLGALLKSMLGLLSKPQAAAHLFASEGHAQAGTSTQEPALTASLQSAAATATNVVTPQQDLQPQASEATAEEAAQADSLTPGKDTQLASAEIKPAVSHKTGPGVCADEAVREADREANREADTDGNMMKYQPGSSQSPARADSIQNVSWAGLGNAPEQSQLPLAESQADVADATSNAVQKTDSPAVAHTQEGKVAQVEPKPPAEGQPEPPQRDAILPEGQVGQDDRQPEGTVMAAATVDEQLPVQAAVAAPVLTDIVSADHPPVTDPDTVATVPQQQTLDRKQLGGVRTAEAGVDGGPSGGSKQQGPAKGGWTGGLKMQLSGSAAQALAVLQAGMPSRSARLEEEAGL